METKIVNGINNDICIGLAPKNAGSYLVGQHDNEIGLDGDSGMVYHSDIKVGKAEKIVTGHTIGLCVYRLPTSEKHGEDGTHITNTYMVSVVINQKLSGPTRIIRTTDLALYPSIGFGKRDMVVQTNFSGPFEYDVSSKFLFALTDTLHLQNTCYFQIQKSI